MRRTALLALVATALAAPRALAIDVADGKLSIDGYGEWSLQVTDRGRYLRADVDGDWTTALFDLLLVGRPSPDVLLQAMVGFAPGPRGEDVSPGTGPSEVRLEWLFAEWRISDLLRARLGKSKQPLGNYGELQFIGTARPFYTLPTALYGPANVAADAYSGIGLTGSVTGARGFGLEYDLYGGAFEMKNFEPWEATSTTPPGTEAEVVESVVGGRVSLLLPWDCALRVSGLTGGVRKGARTAEFHLYGASLFHRGDRLWLSLEAFRSEEIRVEHQNAAYAEAAWFFTEHLQGAARVESQRTHVVNHPDAPMRIRRHDEVALGLNWWFTPQLVVKASVHRTRGDRFVEAELGHAVTRTDVSNTVVTGMQFCF